MTELSSYGGAKGEEFGAGRGVNVVGVDVSKARVSGAEELGALRRGLEERVVEARIVELGVERVADEAVVPPELERSDVVVVRIDQWISQLQNFFQHQEFFIKI